MRTLPVWITCLGIGVGLTAPAQAIDLHPEDVIAPRTSFQAVQIGWTDSRRGDYFVRGEQRASNTAVHLQQVHVRLTSAFTWRDQPAVAYAQVPVGEIRTQNTGATDAGRNMGDLSLVLASWPYVDRERDRYFGLATYLILPTGDYDPQATRQLNTNLAENRWRAALQLGWHQRLLDRLGWMVAVDGVWFGDNNAYYGTSAQLGTLSRAPLYTLQTALSTRLGSTVGLGLSYFYTAGGETAFDGVDDNNAVRVHRYQLSGNLYLPRSRLTLQYGGDIKTRTGFKEDRGVQIRYSHIF